MPDRHSQSSFTPVLDRNIEALCRRRSDEAVAARWQDRLAAQATRFTGSLSFVYIHLAFFSFWIASNLGWVPGLPIWDPSFAVLAMVASVEAIFLSTFVLMTQNRMATSADKRADLDLQISLLTEHEITKLATLVAAISEKLGIAAADDLEMRQVQEDVRPEEVLDRIEGANTAHERN